MRDTEVVPASPRSRLFTCVRESVFTSVSPSLVMNQFFASPACLGRAVGIHHAGDARVAAGVLHHIHADAHDLAVLDAVYSVYCLAV
ncbi:MAG: hypothetical protein V8T36_07775 [Ruthenibacterium lactatiformans]